MTSTLITQSSLRSLVGRLIIGLIYIYVYDFLFYHFVYSLFHYMGPLDYINMDFLTGLAWSIISIIPILFFNPIKRPSTFMVVMIYCFIYIPFVHAMFVAYRLNPWTIYSYSFIMCSIMSIYFYTGNMDMMFKGIVVKPSLSLTSVEIITGIMTMAVVILRHDSMHFVNIFTQVDELYTLRVENAVGGFITYIQGWLSGAFYPFLLVCYLKNKQLHKSLVILFGYLLLFMIDMQKLTFLLPFILSASYYVIYKKEKIFTHHLHSFLTIIILVFAMVFTFMEDDKILFMIFTLIILRTVCVAGWLTQFYVYFFQNHPYTYYSHINVINLLTDSYPYNQSLGYTVAYGTQNANANFFLTDGVAACGWIGLIIIGIIFWFFLQLIDSISQRYDKKDIIIIFLPALSFLLNASVFTTLLTNGVFWLILLISCTDNPLVQKSVK